MNILISGASGFIGTPLTSFLSSKGHHVLQLSRRQPSSGGPAVIWDPRSGEIEHDKLRNLGAVIHLAGENLAGAGFQFRFPSLEQALASIVRGL